MRNENGKHCEIETFLKNSRDPERKWENWAPDRDGRSCCANKLEQNYKEALFLSLLEFDDMNWLTTTNILIVIITIIIIISKRVISGGGPITRYRTKKIKFLDFLCSSNCSSIFLGYLVLFPIMPAFRKWYKKWFEKGPVTCYRTPHHQWW